MLDGDKRAKGPRVPDDVWEFPRLVGNARERIKGHPCQLPEALLERVIRCSTAPGDMVLDPTAGTGTTLRVAQRLDRRYIGIEEQDTFLQLIESRLEQPIQRELFLWHLHWPRFDEARPGLLRLRQSDFTSRAVLTEEVFHPLFRIEMKCPLTRTKSATYLGTVRRFEFIAKGESSVVTCLASWQTVDDAVRAHDEEYSEM